MQNTQQSPDKVHCDVLKRRTIFQAEFEASAAVRETTKVWHRSSDVQRRDDELQRCNQY